MNELSIFSGIGGSLLASLYLKWRTIGYVERDDYCQRIIAQRIRDGFLQPAPIFGDIDHFMFSGAAAQYRGFVDVVTADIIFPGQSTINGDGGADSGRNLWPSLYECIRVVRPRYCFLAGLPNLVSKGYINRIIADLTSGGYDCRWRLLSAAELGAPHGRQRFWLVAYSNDVRPLTEEGIAERPEARKASDRRVISSGGQWGRWWEFEPGLDRLVYGVPDRMERLKALGGGQVPGVAAAAWDLMADVGEGCTGNAE